MNKEIIQAWDDRKDRLEKHFKREVEFYSECDYLDVVKTVVSVVLNGDLDIYDVGAIKVIDDGDWQGVEIYIIPRNTYQPAPDDYLVTYQYYGSCSGCDALLSLQEDYGAFNEEIVDGLMTLSLHLIQNMKFLYSSD